MNQVSWNKQAALAGALLILGTTAYWLEYKHRPDSEKKEEQTKKVFHLKDTRIQQIILADGTHSPFAFQCNDSTGKLCKPGDPSKWEITEPKKFKGDDTAINSLVSSINQLSSSEVIDLKDETPEKRAALLKEYGLDSATRTQPQSKRVEVVSDKQKLVLHVGITHPMNDAAFAMIAPDENHVLLIPSYFGNQFNHDLTHWRDKKLVTLSTHEVNQFQLTSSKVKIQGDKKDGNWSLKTPTGESFPGDLENIESLLTAATFLNGKNFASESKSDTQARRLLQGAKKVLSLTLTGNSSIELTLYRKTSNKLGGGSLFAMTSNLDPLFELDLATQDRLDVDSRKLRLSKLITSMDRFSTKWIKIQGKTITDGSIEVLSKDTQWTLAKTQKKVSTEKVQNFLDKLSGNRIQNFLKTVPHNSSDGVTVTLGEAQGSPKRTYQFWKSASKVYAQELGSSARKETYEVDPSLWDAIPITSAAFESTSP